MRLVEYWCCRLSLILSLSLDLNLALNLSLNLSHDDVICAIFLKLKYSFESLCFRRMETKPNSVVDINVRPTIADLTKFVDNSSRSIKCDECGKTFRSNSARQFHIVKTHREIASSADYRLFHRISSSANGNRCLYVCC